MPALFTFTRFLPVNTANLALISLLLAHGCASGEVPNSATPEHEPIWSSGQILGVDRVPVDQYNDSTVRLVVTTEAPTPVNLELGPGWYVDEQGLSFQPEQRVEYRGKANDDGGFTVYEIRRGESKVQLRNDNGEPEWQARPKP